MKKITRCAVGAFILLFVWGCSCNESKNHPPQAPTNLTATAGNSVVTLNWQASDGATGYNIYMGNPDCTSLTKVASTSRTSYRVTGLTNGTQYCFVVRAYNADGESANSNQATATPVAPLPPQAPTNLTTAAGFSLVTLRWDASSGATGYRIYIGSPDCSTFISTTTTTGTSVQVTGLTNDIQYCFVVRAYNAAGESSDSNTATATPSASAPLAPTLCSALPSLTSVTLTWTAGAGPIPTGYNIYIGTAPSSYTYLTSTTATIFTVTGLTSGTTYYFVVTAVNASGESAYSNELSAITLGGCITAGSNYLTITSASPAPGSTLTTASSYTFQLNASYTLTTPIGYLALIIRDQNNVVLASFSQPVSGGSGSSTLTASNVFLNPTSTWILAGVVLSDSTGANVGFDTASYTVDSAYYFRVQSSTPADGTPLSTGPQDFSFAVFYNLPSGTDTLSLYLYVPNFGLLCFPCASAPIPAGSGTVILSAPGVSIPSGATSVYAYILNSGFTSLDYSVSFPILSPNIVLDTYTVSDLPPGGNGNGVVNPGETFDLQVLLRDLGTLSATGVQATLTSTFTGVTINTPGPVMVGDITSGCVGITAFNISIASWVAPLTIINFTLQIGANGGSYSTTLFFSITVVFSPPTPECTMFSDNIEAGVNGFTATSISPTVYWHQVQDGVNPCANSHSPTHSWWYGQDSTCTYNNGWANNGALYSPLIATCSTTATTATLSFWSWEQTECFGSCPWDVRRVYLSTNGGASWTQVWQSPSLTISSWYQVWVPLTGITSGTPIKLRFYFDTIDNIGNSYQGWYIDDIQITQP